MEEKRIKRLKLEEEEEEDRISALPDSLIHHILSFLPSTKQAIRTGILSKRWQNQWSRVPVLIFDSIGKPKNFSQFIDRTLTQHDCSKIEKFHIKYDCDLEGDSQLTSKIRFAIRNDVEELILNLFPQDEYVDIPYVLPEFLYNNASLLKLELFKCSFLPDNRSINWSHLKELKLDCYFIEHTDLENIVFGCPLLESLELSWISGFHSVVIASKSLKRLIFVDCTQEFHGGKLEISCPNLKELFITLSMEVITWSIGSESIGSKLPGQTIENVLSGSPLLHTLELSGCSCSDRLVIASKSLKKLVLGKMYKASDFEIACPDLEELNLYQFDPSVLSSFGGFDSDSPQERCLAMKILGQAKHVKVLEIGSWFIKVLSALEMEGLSSPVLNCKCLTLDGTNFDEHLPGIICAIRSSPVLEKLNLKLQLDEPQGVNDSKNKKNHWNSNGTVFNCSVSNLKTVKITGLSEEDDKQKLVFKLVEFLLGNAKKLEKIVVILADCETGFLFEVSKKLLSFPRCSPHTIVELMMCST